jgi:hypothetical protein
MVQVEGRMTLCVNRFARKAVSRMTEAPGGTETFAIVGERRRDDLGDILPGN